MLAKRQRNVLPCFLFTSTGCCPYHTWCKYIHDRRLTSPGVLPLYHVIRRVADDAQSRFFFPPNDGDRDYYEPRATTLECRMWFQFVHTVQQQLADHDASGHRLAVFASLATGNTIV